MTSEESGGKRRRSKTRHENPWLRQSLSEAAWAASHAKNSYFVVQFRRIAARRGKKRALLAVGHSLLCVFYHILKDHTEYKDLGRDYFECREPERLQQY